jgi:hypothetical protein
MLSALRQLDHQGKLSLASFDDMLTNTPDRNNLSLLGTIIEPKRLGARLYSFSYGATQRSVKGGMFRAAGSGEPAFRTFLPKLLQLIPTPISDDDLYEWGDLFALNLASNFLGRELFTGKNLVDMWGGGFEVAAFQTNGSFAKLDEVLFIFFGVILSPKGDEGAIRFLPLLIKNQYFEDALIVRITECEIVGKELRALTDRHPDHSTIAEVREGLRSNANSEARLFLPLSMLLLTLS